MATKPKKQATLPTERAFASLDKATRETVNIYATQHDEKPYETFAKQMISPAFGAGAAIQKIDGNDFLDVNALIAVLREQGKAINDNDMRKPERMLMAQAQTLEALFYKFVRSGVNQTALVQFETQFRIALKAQSQCRMTLETLAEMKNPKSVAFIKQANVAGGHQQVNNNQSSTRARTRTGENGNDQSKLLGEATHETLDTRGTRAAGKANSPVEAVGAVNRR